MDLSIVIPCYNESKSLARLFSVCATAIPTDLETEVLFVDNGSTDDSASRLTELACMPEFYFARIVAVPDNQGYGHGIMAGARAATGSVIAWTHADLQTDPTDVIAAYRKYRKPLSTGVAIVKGQRTGRNFFDTFFTAGMSYVASAVLNTKMSDINAQPKIFNRSLLTRLDAAPDDFSLDVYLLYVARREGMEILDYPVTFDERKHGEAKGGGSFKGKMKLIKRTLAFLFKLRSEIREGRR